MTTRSGNAWSESVATITKNETTAQQFSSGKTAVWWAGKDSNLRRHKPADLQSAPFGRLGTDPQGCQPIGLGIVFTMPSFDIVSEVDKQELKNAVDQAQRELANRLL